MRVVFFGTPTWAVPSLDALLDAELEVRGVVAPPDRPAGRGMEVAAPPVKERALERGLEAWQPPKVRDEGFHELLRGLGPDVCVVVAYGKILPASLLAIPRLGFVNVHFSLLPAYRGAAPVQRAVMAGDKVTGVSIMVLTEGMDEGPLLATRAVDIGSRETAGELGERLADIGADLLVESLEGYGSGRLEPAEQDHASATYAPKITTEEAAIDWTRPASAIDAHVRGLNPGPGAWTTLAGQRLKVHVVEPVEASLGPGEIAIDDGPIAGTGDGVLRLAEVQLAGKKRMTGAELARGFRIEEGARLG